MSTNLEVDLQGLEGQPPASGKRGHGFHPDHLVQFYHSDAFLCDVVVKFLAAGLAAGEPVVVVATQHHREAFGRGLGSLGFNLERAQRLGQITMLDARETLSKLMVGTMPNWELFETVIGGALSKPVRQLRCTRVRAYGEMVDLLWNGGNPQAAIRLEDMWNELQEEQSFTLLCAYVMGSFYKEAAGIHAVCRAHARVLPPEQEPEVDARALTAEIAQTRQVEKALRESLRELRRAEEELRQSQQDLHDFVENAAVGIHWVGPDGKILFANRAELELMGYTKEEYVGRPIEDFHADADACADILRRLRNNETLHDREAQLRTKDGSIKDVLISSNVRWEDGKFVHTRCFTRDITGQKHLETDRNAAVRQTERLVKITAAIADAVTREQVFEAVVDQVASALEASSGALWIADEENHARLLRSVGYTDAARQKFMRVPLDHPSRPPAIDAIRTGQPIWIASQEELLARYPHLAAAVSPGRSYRIACLPILIQGRPLAALGFSFDGAPPIDKDQRDFLMLVAGHSGQALERLRLLEGEKQSRARAEEATSRAELLYQLVGSVIGAKSIDDVFASALDAIESALRTRRSSVLVFDPDGVMRFKAWRGLSDDYRRAVEGHSPWTRDVVAPEPILVDNVERDPSMSSYLPLFRAEKIGALGFIPLVAGGRLIGKFMVYYDEPRELAPHDVEIARAIANHVASAIERFAAVSELEKAVRFNEMFTAILGHDLRNPLGGIMAAAQLVLRRNENERVAKSTGRILSSGQRMSRMIDQLLDFSRARLGRGIPLEPKRIDLVPLVRQVLAELDVAHPDWTMHVEHEGDTDGEWDEDRLGQVFSNLIGNAVQHGVAHGGIRVHVDGADPSTVRITVKNQGVVPADLVPKLFEPMTGGERRRNNSHGLGLGLFITAQIVKAHGGRIEVESNEAKGTIFAIALPRVATRSGIAP